MALDGLIGQGISLAFFDPSKFARGLVPIIFSKTRPIVG